MVKKTFSFLSVFYCLSAFLISALNDVISKKAGLKLGGINVLFFRFFFSVLCFAPIIFFNRQAFVTKQMGKHMLRGGLFALAMLPWSYGLISLPLPLITTIGFTTPLFVTVLARLFLNEKLEWRRTLATLLGFSGIVVSVGWGFSDWNLWVGLGLLATVLFATLDILNKYLLTNKEGLIPMTFFSALWTCLFTLPLAAYDWVVPSYADLFFLMVLGGGANLFLFLLLKAFSLSDISSLQPFRYFEFLFSCVLSYFIFDQSPSLNVLLGVCLIIPATLYLTCFESFHKKKNQKSSEDVALETPLNPEPSTPQ
jgi:S-adenosylmethionine uptake transporter